MKKLVCSLSFLALAVGAIAQTPAHPPAAPATPAVARRPAAAPPAPAATINAAIAELETERLGACAANNRAITRVSGGESQYRLATERRIRDGGVRMYRYVYRATGCAAQPRRHNVEIYVHQGLAPMVLMLPMGTTALTSDVLNGVFNSLMTPMMRARYPRCQPRSLKILEANIATGTPYIANHPWTERWRYDACGALGNAVITFNYDGQGLRTTANVTPDGAAPAAAPASPATPATGAIAGPPS